MLKEILIAIGALIIVLLIIVPAVLFTRPTTYAIKYSAMYVNLQDNALKVIDSADYEEHFSPFKLAAVSGNEMCTHISQQFNTVGMINCENEGSIDNPNFILSNNISIWGLGGLDFKIPLSDLQNNCSNPELGYNCYKTVYVDLNGQSGSNQLGSDVFRIRLRFDGKVDTLPDWDTENSLLESLL